MRSGWVGEQQVARTYGERGFELEISRLSWLLLFSFGASLVSSLTSYTFVSLLSTWRFLKSAGSFGHFSASLPGLCSCSCRIITSTSRTESPNPQITEQICAAPGPTLYLGSLPSLDWVSEKTHCWIQIESMRDTNVACQNLWRQWWLSR